jgi:hypothetical protein
MATRAIGRGAWRTERVTDRTKLMLSAVAGAAGGAVAGYLLLTKSGEEVRARLPVLEDVIGRLQDLQASVQHARGVADQSWSTLRDITLDTTGRAQ